MHSLTRTGEGVPRPRTQQVFMLTVYQASDVDSVASVAFKLLQAVLEYGRCWDPVSSWR